MYAPGDQASLLVVSPATCHGVGLACSSLSIRKNSCIATIHDDTDQIIGTCLQQTAASSGAVQMLIGSSAGVQHHSTSHLEDVILACIL